jgi:YMGG-like Gly-zipper
MRTSGLPLALILALGLTLLLPGCATKGQTGAVAGAGVGALAGQLIGHNTTSTLIGAAVGTGVGYIVGNEADKKHASEVSRQTAATGYQHNEVGPLGGTRWNLVSLEPKNVAPPYVSKILDFQPTARSSRRPPCRTAPSRSRPRTTGWWIRRSSSTSPGTSSTPASP